MRTMTMMTLMLAVSVAGAQQPGKSFPKLEGGGQIVPPPPIPKKSALEEALDLALKNNPDLRVAASKLALAEAELSRTRLQVTQKVAAAYADILTELAVVAEIGQQLARVRKLHETGNIPTQEVSKVEVQLSERKAKLAAAERELNHLQGKSPQKMGAVDRNSYSLSVKLVDIFDLHSDFGGSAGSSNIGVVTPKTDGTDKLGQALKKPVTLSSQGMTLADYLALMKKTAGVGIQADAKDPVWKETVAFDFKDVTVGGMLQFLEDSMPGHRIVVRHYGLLVTTKEKVPPGALTLTAFLHAEPTKAAEQTPGTGAGKPVEGKITLVEGDQRCYISIGFDAGVRMGQLLEVYSVGAEPKYLGRIKASHVSDYQAECRVVGTLQGKIKVGDRVTTRLVGK